MPKQIGPYLVQREIGRGGMGVVYQAHDPKLGREVAVKVLPDDLTRDPARVARFREEARTLAALNHPNILTIHDVDSDGEMIYVVTELLEGRTLSEELTSTALTSSKASEIGAGIAEGLAAAHARGVVHRDLKPDNIFLTRDGVVKILDFGLARAGGDKTADALTRTRATAPGTVMGTVGYMAPEQVRGDSADARSDIFSFGCVLYEMLTGTRAFQRDTPAESMTAILKEQPRPPREITVDLSPDVERVLSRCLEKDPGQRFQSSRDLAFTLRGVSSIKTPGSGSVMPPAARSRRMPLVAAVVVAAVLAGLFLVWFFRRPATGGDGAIDSLAVLPFSTAGVGTDDAFLGEGIAESVINSLLNLPDLRVVPRNTAFRHSGREADLDAVAEELDVRAIVTGRVTRRGERLLVSAELVDTKSQAQLWGERYDAGADDILSIEADISRQITEALRLQLSGEEAARRDRQYTSSPQAHMAYIEARYWWSKRTGEGFQKALELFESAIGHDPEYALAYAGKAETYCLMGFYTHRPAEVYPLISESAETAIEIDPDLAEAYPALAFSQSFFRWDWEAGEQAFRKAIELNPNYATAHHWYGVYLSTLSRFDEAHRELERAQELDPGSSIIRTDRAMRMFAMRDYDQAERLLREAIETDPGFYRFHELLCDVLTAQGRYEEAFAALHTALDLAGEMPYLDGKLGLVLALAGRRDDALKELDELQQTLRTRYVSPVAIGDLHAALGDMDLAFEWYGKSMEAQDYRLPFTVLSPNHDFITRDPRWQELRKRMGLSSNQSEPSKNR